MENKRVLVVEDVWDLGRLLQSALMTIDSNLPVTVVPSAEEAMLESTRAPVSLLVADVRLPGMSGLELLRRFRSRYPAVKVIVMTGLMDETLKQKAFEMGANVFMHKPINLDEFLERVKECLDMPAHSPMVPLVSSGSEVTKASGEQLADILTGLRGSVGAVAAILLDEAGRAVAQAGALPAEEEAKLIPPVMAALNAGVKATHLLGEAIPEIAQVFKLKQYDLVLTPVDPYTLLLAIERKRGSLRLALALEEALAAQKVLLVAVSELGTKTPVGVLTLAEKISLPEPQMPVVPVVPVVEPPAATPAAMAELESLLGQPGLSMDKNAVDDFWDTAGANAENQALSPDVLSYDQAKRMGLSLPEEE